MPQQPRAGKGAQGSGIAYVERMLRRTILHVSLLLVVTAGTAQAQTQDTVATKHSLFKGSDAVLLSGFIAATLAAAPADRHFTHQLQDPARQANRLYDKGATVFRIFGNPGGLVASSGIYLVGLAAGNRRTQDLGLHAVESILAASTIITVTKVTVGRARPRKSPGDPRDFGLFRGVKDDEYRSFPSGHSGAAFAFAALVSSETGRMWPEAKWVIGPVLYGSAALTGVSRIYNNAHWASDVLAGAAIGTLTGLKVYRFQHSHPDNRLDKYFLRAGVQASNNGTWGLILMPGR
jgi:membrane-associated phospholipid phosphatase